ncbi:MAG: hypothetical protein HeimC2_22100 [Candidatus Heimdallarchaeota archaeon LC_2]|nr:MAG: hypothetical protein HeimC2_22100 [Candidatus Heimdallarchaeota archaeon LC_2]
MAFCTTCGTDNTDTSTFCGNCGAKMEAQSSKAMDTQPSKAMDTQPSKAMDTQPYQEEPPHHQEQPQYQQGQPQYQQGQPQYQQGQPQYQQGQPQYQPPQYGYQPGGMDIKPPRTGWLTYVLVVNWIGVGAAILFGILFLGLASEFESTFGAGGGILSAIAIIIILSGLLLASLTVHLNRYSNTARIISLILQVLAVLGALNGPNIFTLVISGLQIYALGFHKETVNLFKGVPQY